MKKLNTRDKKFQFNIYVMHWFKYTIMPTAVFYLRQVLIITEIKIKK